MRIIGVLDLKAGHAVHAIGGARERYQPVRTCAGRTIDGDPVALATAYRDAFGIEDLYVADLDAIQGRDPAFDVIDRLLERGRSIWLDAGISAWSRAQEAINRGVARVVIGLETLTSFEALDVICISVGGERVAFSLDLRNGEPLPASGGADVGTLAARAATAGVGAIIVLDLARVGMGSGVDAETVRVVRTAAPGVMLLAGGGVRNRDDVDRLGDAGCDGVLVATALHAGLPLA